MSELRANLKSNVERAKAGERIVVTERGVPVARLGPAEMAGTDTAVALWDDAARVVASRLSIPEVSAALAAAERGGRIDGARARAALDEWRHRSRPL